MGQCLDKLPHSCGTRKGLQVFAKEDGKVDGYCFSCKKYVEHPYGEEKSVEELPKPKIKTQKEIEAEMAEVSGYPIVDIKQKKLRASSLEFYGVRVGFSEEDGKTPELLYYPYTRNGKIVAYKVKLLEPKRIWSIGDFKDVDFFGWEEALKMGARKIIITEGEDDAISVRRAIELYSREDFKNYTAVVSVPSGVHSAKEFILNKHKELKQHFSEIILCFDTDEPGRRAVDQVCSIMPDITSISVPAKDANECIIQGKTKALYNSLFKTSKPKNTRIVFGSEVHDAAKEPPKYGELTWPWPHINEETRGIRYGETIYLGAGVKMGKSEVVNAIGAHLIKNHGIKILMAKPEEENKHTYKLVAGKIVGKIFHDPKVEFDEEAYDQAGEIIKDNLMMINLYQHLGWETLKEDIIAAANYGAKAIFIDPITNLTSGYDSGQANTMLEAIAKELSAMAKDLNIVIFIFCHLRAYESNISKEKRDKFYRDGKYMGLGNCPHEMGGDVQSMQFAGSRAMMRSCNMMIGIEGNKDPELDPEIRNIRQLKILEDRMYGSTGIFPIYWNKNTSLFKEI